MYDFHFTPKNEEELSDLLEEGEGTYQVIKAERKEKDGFVMIVLTLKVWDKHGQFIQMTDYMKLDPGSNFCMRKVRHFCYSCGLNNEWDKGRFSAADCMNKSGKLVIATQKESTKDGKTHPAKSVVRDYSMDTANLQGAVNILQKRRETQNGRDLPPVTAYDDIPV
jgi:hypothetical protein